MIKDRSKEFSKINTTLDKKLSNYEKKYLYSFLIRPLHSLIEKELSDLENAFNESQVTENYYLSQREVLTQKQASLQLSKFECKMIQTGLEMDDLVIKKFNLFKEVEEVC